MAEKTEKVQREKDGIIIKEEDTPIKMQVNDDEIKTAGDRKKSPVYIYYDWCVKCGICISFCPTKALGKRPDGYPFLEYPDKCIHCETCDRLCPNFAITGAKEK